MRRKVVHLDDGTKAIFRVIVLIKEDRKKCTCALWYFVSTLSTDVTWLFVRDNVKLPDTWNFLKWQSVEYMKSSDFHFEYKKEFDCYVMVLIGKIHL